MDKNEQLPEFADGSLIPDPVVKVAAGDRDLVKLGRASIGVTKKSHEESKARRRMAAKSRKINRRK